MDEEIEIKTNSALIGGEIELKLSFGNLFFGWLGGWPEKLGLLLPHLELKLT